MAARLQDYLARAERLRKIVRRKTDAPLRQIEAEVVAHRPAEPRIAVRLRRPDALDQTAEHQPVDRLQARFEQAENVHPCLGLRPIGRAVGNGLVEQLGVVGGGHIERAGLFDLGEGSGERRRHAAQRHDDFGMARGDCSDRLRPARHGFQRRQRLFELRDKRGRGVKLGFGQR